MKTKRFETVMIFACAVLFTTHSAQAFYNPSTGRWLSRDPARESDENTYCFVRNQPASAFDRLGLATLTFNTSARYNVPRPLDPSDPDTLALTLSQWEPTRSPGYSFPESCSPGRLRIHQEDWTVHILEQFTMSQQEAQTQITGRNNQTGLASVWWTGDM